MIYFDSASTSLLKPGCVAEAVTEAISGLGGASRGGHDAAIAANRKIHAARAALAELFGSQPSRVAFTLNATESLNTAINGLLGTGGHAITTALEHNSVLRPLYRLGNFSVAGADKDGALDHGSFKRLLRRDTKAVVATHASNLTGYMPDIGFIGRFCRDNGLVFILDASQTAGVFPVDMEKDNIDVLCFTGHKSLFGPQGTGGLCVRGGVKIQPLKVGGSGIRSFDEAHPSEMPDALEAGTPNSHGIAGLLAGVGFIRETGMDKIREKECGFAEAFRDEAAKIPGIKLYGTGCGHTSPIVALNAGDLDSSETSGMLSREYGICTRPGGHCAPLLHRAMGTEKRGAVRFSFSYFNTPEEVEAGLQALREIAGRYCG